MVIIKTLVNGKEEVIKKNQFNYRNIDDSVINKRESSALQTTMKLTRVSVVQSIKKILEVYRDVLIPSNRKIFNHHTLTYF